MQGEFLTPQTDQLIGSAPPSPILLCCGLRTGRERLRDVVVLPTAAFLQLRETKA